MKCLVCGSDCPDDWVTCPKDGNDLRSPTPTVEPREREPDEMIAPAYGLPPMAPPETATAKVAQLKALLGADAKGPREVLPAYGAPPVAVPREPELMVSAYGMVPMPPPPASPVPNMMPAYGMPPVGAKPRPLLALAIVVLVMAGAIVAVVLSR